MDKRLKKLNWFYVPAICTIVFFVVKPFCEAIYISLCDWNGYSPKKIFVGFENYLDMFSDAKLGRSFINTIIYGFGSTLLQNLIGMGIALFVNSRFKGHNMVRTIVYMPIMISALIMGYIMYFFLCYDNSVLNEIISWFGYEPIDWLVDGKRAVIFITLINSWQYLGGCMIIYLSGLQSIPKMYEEAAKIEGAGTFQCFKYITLPLLVPAISTAVITNLIGGLNLFDVVVSLTEGGPNHTTHSLVSYLNNQYFKAEKAGYSSAIGISMFVLIMVITLVGNHFFDKRRVEM